MCLASTFTGATTVSGGTLVAGGSLAAALSATDAVTVNSGGTLLLGASNQINDNATMTLAGDRRQRLQGGAASAQDAYL